MGGLATYEHPSSPWKRDRPLEPALHPLGPLPRATHTHPGQRAVSSRGPPCLTQNEAAAGAASRVQTPPPERGAFWTLSLSPLRGSSSLSPAGLCSLHPTRGGPLGASDKPHFADVETESQLVEQLVPADMTHGEFQAGRPGFLTLHGFPAQQLWVCRPPARPYKGSRPLRGHQAAHTKLCVTAKMAPGQNKTLPRPPWLWRLLKLGWFPGTLEGAPSLDPHIGCSVGWLASGTCVRGQHPQAG